MAEEVVLPSATPVVKMRKRQIYQEIPSQIRRTPLLFIASHSAGHWGFSIPKADHIALIASFRQEPPSISDADDNM